MNGVYILTQSQTVLRMFCMLTFDLNKTDSNTNISMCSIVNSFYVETFSMWFIVKKCFMNRWLLFIDICIVL